MSQVFRPSVIELPSGFGLAIDTSTGESFEILGGKVVKDDWQKLTEKYLGRSAARRLLSKFRVSKRGAGEVPAYRVVRCGWAVLNQKEGVSVFRALAAQRAHFAGTVQCGSVWHCPVCSSKIAARRSAEMVVASERCRADGGAVMLATATVKHSASDSAAQSVERLQTLWDRMNAGKRAKAWRESFGVVGQIKAIEFTIGGNGWHPHVHSLLFLRHPQPVEAVAEGLRFRYIGAAKSEFGWLLPDVAVDVRDGAAAANYISGWGIESEVSGGAWKTGKNGSSAPFDLLLQFSSPDCSRSERAEAGRRFVEFATAVSRITEGRVSTVRQLVWSRGLKDRFGVDEKTDEETAAAMEEPALLLGNLGFDDWLRVLNVKAFDARLVVLQLASLGDWSEVRRFVDSLPQPQSQKE